MSFYSDLSFYYDEIFQLSLEEKSFILHTMNGCKRILDIGCATGAKTALCASIAERVVGIDPDIRMIQKAREANSSIIVSYQEGGLLDVGVEYPKGAFDGILCLGNTLVHLPDEVIIQNATTGIAHALSDSGLFVLQIINYDRIIMQGVSSLPRIETKNTVFERTYRFTNGTMFFDTTLFIKHIQKAFQHSIPLFPLRKDRLHVVLRNAGFSIIEFFGDFAQGKHDESSMMTIATCTK